MTSVHLADGITTTGSFQNYIKLEEIILPESVSKFGDYGGTSSFQNCAKLKRITILNPKCQINDSGSSICNYTLNGTPYYDGTIYGTGGSTSQSYAEKYGYQFALIGSQPEFLLGDINDDGEISVEDAQLTLIAYVQQVAGLESNLTEKQTLAADINGDQSVTVEDAQMILIYYVRNTVSGIQTSWDELIKNMES